MVYKWEAACFHLDLLYANHVDGHHVIFINLIPLSTILSIDN